MTTPVVTVSGAKPLSIKVEPWTDFTKQAYSIHSDDFCHTKCFVAKFTAKGSRSTLNIKETVGKSKEGNYHVEDDVKLWFDLPSQHSLYTRVKSNNYIKVHYDHGLTAWNDSQWNLYGTFWTNKSLTSSSVRVGVATYNPKYNSDNRLRINTSSGSHHFHWYNRTLSTYNSFKFGIVSVVDLCNKVLQKNNILIGYTFNNKNQSFIRLQNEGFRSSNPQWADVRSLWDTVTANHVVRLDSTTRVGLEGGWNLKSNQLHKVEAVVEKFIPESGITVKAKANNRYDVALLFKRALWGVQDLATVSLGLGVNNAISDKRNIQHGIQVDFNI